MKKFTLITGASRGIGKAFAKALAQKGKNLVLFARSKNELEKLASDLQKKHSIEVITLQEDLAELDSAEKLFEKTEDLKIEMLINQYILLYKTQPK